MKTLLTFLGTAPYSATTYVLGDQRHTSRYCPAAVAHFVRPELTLVVVTEAARAKHYDALVKELASVTAVEAVDIPDGHSENDLWMIFEALTSRIEAGTKLVVDITNGFRSLPFLSFLALAFLRVAKEVDVQAVYYGAWDARNQETNESPIFDLTSFVILLDWTVATDQFLETGDSQTLAEQLLQAHQLPWRRGNDDSLLFPRRLQGVAGTLTTLGQALRLARAEEMMAGTATLQENLTAVRSEADAWAKPFALLLDRMAEDYGSFALTGDVRTAENRARSLEIQRSLASWYVDRRQYVQAILLARELVVGFTTQALGWDMIDDRHTAEELLNALMRLGPKGRIVQLDADVAPAIAMAVHLWTWLPDLRNDIAHVGMRVQPRPVSSLIKAAEALPTELAQLDIGGVQSPGGLL